MDIIIENIAINIVHNLDVGLYIYHLENVKDDHTLRMIFANKAAEKFTTIPIDQVVGKTLDDSFPELRGFGIPQIYADVVRSKKAIHLDDIFYSDNRNTGNWYAVKAFPLPQNCMGVSFENITERKNTELARQKLINQLQTALSEIKTLRGLIPICMDCKKIRDDKGLWTQVDQYIEAHTDAELSHSICEDCLNRRYGDDNH